MLGSPDAPTLALYRDKDGRTVLHFPFILVVDGIMNRGAIYQDEVTCWSAYADDEDLMGDSTPDDVLVRLARRGMRVHYMRSEADFEDDMLVYFAIADGQLQEIMAATWVRQDLAFPGAEFVAWGETAPRLYTDGEVLFDEGHSIMIELPEDDPRHAPLAAQVKEMLDAYVVEVAAELRAKVLPGPRRRRG